MVRIKSDNKSSATNNIHNFNLENISPILVEKYIKDVKFPASKNDLIKQAQKNEAPEIVIQLLNKIANEEYNSVIDVAAEASQARNM